MWPRNAIDQVARDRMVLAPPRGPMRFVLEVGILFHQGQCVFLGIPKNHGRGLAGESRSLV